MPLIQLSPHTFSSVPAHPSLPSDPSRPELGEFIRDALREAHELLDTTIPSSFRADPKLRSSSPSDAKVKLLQGWRKPSQVQQDAKPEFWVCRSSKHVDSDAKSGTASWREFEAGLRIDHAEHEMEYTPSVSSVERLLEWSDRPELRDGVEVEGVRYNDVTVEINMITHTFHPSALIAPRAFISLTVSAAFDNRTDKPSGQEPEQQQQQQSATQGFVTVQIPLTATGSSTPAAVQEKVKSAAPRRTIFAHYASVERVELLAAPASPPNNAESSSTTAPDSADNPSPRHIHWTMATTSDAGGSIPQWVQRSWTMGGVPRAVVADVGLFIGWTERRRQAGR